MLRFSFKASSPRMSVLGEKELNALKSSIDHGFHQSCSAFAVLMISQSPFSTNRFRMSSCPSMAVFVRAVLPVSSVYDISCCNENFAVLKKRWSSRTSLFMVLEENSHFGLSISLEEDSSQRQAWPSMGTVQRG